MAQEPTYKLALITGATSGIGEAFARLLASKNIPIILVGRNETKLKELSTQLNAQSIRANLAVRAERAPVIDAIKEKRPDLVVNNAGLGYYGEVADQPVDDLLEICDVNIEAVLEIAAETVKILKQHHERGTVLNVSSAAAWPPFPLSAVYGASKSFVYQLSRSMDYETKPYGIRVFASCPGVVSTHFSARALHKPEAGEMRGKAGGVSLMSSDFAAQQMWMQLKKQQQTRIYNGFYRFVTFLVNHVLPESLTAAMTRKELSKLLRKKEF